MIGLVDLDWLQSTQTSRLVPNLEIMKLATYYRLEENTFCRLLPLDEADLSIYEKVYFFSELANPPEVPPHFLRNTNVIYGGSAFTNEQYVPFENSIIDYTIARPAIYKDSLKQKYQDGIKAKVIGHVLDDSYYRMFAGTEKLPIPPMQSNKRLFLYDRDIFMPGWEDIITEIEERHPSSIIPIHPVICKKISDYFSIRNRKISRTIEIILDTNIPLDEVHYMLKRYKKLFLADITDSSSIYLPLGGSFQSDFQYFKDFIYKLNLLYAFWSAGIPIKLKYMPPRIYARNPLENIEKLAEMWAKSEKRKDITLNERMSHRVRKPQTKIYKEEKELLLKFHPTARDLFHQNYPDLVKGGFWRV